jgi:hypothetical protein
MAAALAAGAPALAAQPSDAALARIEARLAEQSKRLAEQDARLQAQQAKIEALEAEREAFLAEARGAGLGAAPMRGVRTLAAAEQPPTAVTELPAGPVGQAPQTAPAPPVTAIPSAMNVLSPKGQLILDPSLEYVRTSNNRLVFRGVEIVAGVQLGLIEASDVARDTAVATLAARYGLTDRLEVEARVPYVYRHDRLDIPARATPEFDPIPQELREDALGDIEVAARYQLNTGRGGWPIFVANTRVKPPTGISPYDVPFDDAGVALDLATGSGFWSLESGLTMIYPSEPAIIFGGLTYLHNFADDVNKEIGGAQVGRVDPGDSIGAQVGFGLSLNPRFSVSLGYSHNYIFPTETEINGENEKSRPLVVGSMLMGWSFRLNERITLNNSFEFGVTSEAPDMRVVLRVPYRF